MKRPYRHPFFIARGCVWLCLVYLGLMATPLRAQSNVDGFIYGSAAPGAEVRVLGTENGVRASVHAAEDGGFRVPALVPGRYRVSSGDHAVEVMVSIGGGSAVRLDAAGPLDVITVVAKADAVDVSRAAVPFEIDEARLDTLPLSRELSGVMLLAPGTHAGDAGFGELVSVGGATVAENQYYLNGFNISDLRDRLVPADVPFEFFRELQVMTGGYSAEFGRTTGGVVNAISKRGGETWEGQVQLTLEPSGTRARKPSVFVDSRPVYYYGADREDIRIVDLSAGGPLLRDQLYLFALLSFEDSQRVSLRPDDYPLSFQRTDLHDDARTRTPFAALALDWQIADGHALNFTTFSDSSEERVRRSTFDSTTLRPDERRGSFRQHSGGITQILRYTGALTDTLTLSALAGRGRVDDSRRVAASDCPFVQDLRSDDSMVLGCWVANTNIDHDERRGGRIDLQWDLDRHHLRAGVDVERNTSSNRSSFSGGAQYFVYAVRAGDPIGSTGSLAPSDGEYVEVVSQSDSGRVSERLHALYLEDRWLVSERVTAQIGLRLDRFDYRNTRGQTFVELDASPAPRLGLTWDVHGDGRAKLFGSYGHYYSPIGTSAAVNLGMRELLRADAFDFEGYADDASQRPMLGMSRGGTVFEDGSVTDPRTLVAGNIEPGYQAETIVGYQTVLPDFFPGRARVSLAYTHRELKRTVEDIALDQGLNAVLDQGEEANLQDCDGDLVADHFACGFDFFFITNPGEAATVMLPTDAASGRFDATGDGPLRALRLPEQVLGYSKPRRRYHAIELAMDAAFAAGHVLEGSYTWSRSDGNYEGIVNSTIQQSAVAITQDFDQPGFLEGANGRLANDRRHRLKLFGALQMTPEWRLGFSAYAQSGRPYSALGFFRDLDSPEAAYAQFSFYSRHPRFTADPEQAALVPRGSAGRSPWLWNLDLALHWQPLRFKAFTASLEAFNVFNRDDATVINEISEDESAQPSAAYGLPRDFQEPRALRLRLALSI